MYGFDIKEVLRTMNTKVKETIDSTIVYTPQDKPSHIAAAEEANSVILSKQLIAKGYPDKDKSQPIQIYRLSEFGLRKAQLGKLLDELTPKVTLSKNKEDINRFRANLRLMIYNLVAVAYEFKWLSIPVGDMHYRKGERLGSFGLSRRRVQAILDVLIREDLAVPGRKGYRHNGRPEKSKSSQYYPTPKLMEYFSSCLYEFSDGLVLPCYHSFNSFASNEPPEPSLWAANEALLRRYNEFMQNHWWARKGPTTRSFSKSIDRGGRLNTGYQNIVNRRLPIRINTLLDGEPISEPDFSSNHLKMASAIAGEVLPDDPYSIIAEQVGTTRDVVKEFVTRVIGCVNKKQKGGQILELASVKEGLTMQMYKDLLAAFTKELPWVLDKGIFYNDTGSRMQKLEGEIALKMIEWAMAEQMPIIAVHDSFAVQKRYEQKTWAKMQQVWEEVVASYRAMQKPDQK